MTHIRPVSATKTIRADATADFYNALWQAWNDFIVAKKNETIPTT